MCLDSKTCKVQGNSVVKQLSGGRGVRTLRKTKGLQGGALSFLELLAAFILGQKLGHCRKCQVHTRKVSS
jgi:hypothetical protein